MSKFRNFPKNLIGYVVRNIRASTNFKQKGPSLKKIKELPVNANSSTFQKEDENFKLKFNRFDLP